MPNPSHIQIVHQGAKAIGQWRDKNPGVRLELAKAELSNIDLTGANLRNADLTFANIVHVKLTEADLRDTDFTGASLTDTDLTRADLHLADFTDAHLNVVTLKDARLKHASFENVGGFDTVRELDTKQLAGTNLKGVALPKSVSNQSLVDLGRVSDHVKYSRNLFLLLIGACMYSWLTIWSASDGSLVANTSHLNLPIINSPLPVIAFFWVAPCVLFGTFIYFLFYLRRLWDRLGLAPAVFPDGTTLDEIADPWIVLTILRQHLPQIRAVNHERSQYWVCVILLWGLVPITLLALWQRYLVVHDLAAALWIGLWCLAAIESSIRSSHAAISALCGNQNALSKHSHSRIPRVSRWTCFAGLLIFSFSVITEYAVVLPWWRGDLAGSEMVHVSHRGKDLRGHDFTDSLMTECDLRGARLEGVKLLRSDLTGSDLTNTFLNGTKFDHAVLARATLRAAIAKNTSFINADLRAVDFRDADLSGASFENANLMGADLRNATLTNCSFQGAILIGANMDRNKTLPINALKNAAIREANLTAIDFRGLSKNSNVQILSRCNLRETDFRGLHVTSMWFHKATLTDALLSSASFTKCDFTYANLDNATLVETQFRNSFMAGASLIGADLKYASLNGADLRNSKLMNADLSYSRLLNADLSRSDLSGATLTKAFYNSATQWPKGFDFQNSGAIGPGAQLANSDLTGVNLMDADLKESNLSGAVLNIVKLSGANLCGCNLSGADLGDVVIKNGLYICPPIYDEHTVWPEGYDFRQAGFIGPGAVLREQRINNSSFMPGPSLTGVNLKDSDFRQLDFKGARLDDADLSRADLRGAKLNRAYMRASNLTGAKLQGADLRNAILIDADLRGAALGGADFTDADLSGAKFGGVTVEPANYDESTVWPDGFEVTASGAVRSE